MAFSVNNCMLVMWLIINTATQINILAGSVRWMSPAMAWLGNACFAFFGAWFMFPYLLHPCALDAWYVVGMTLSTMITTPIVTSMPQAVHMSVLMLAVYRLPAILVCTRPWLVALCNMVPFVVMLLRIFRNRYPQTNDCASARYCCGDKVLVGIVPIGSISNVHGLRPCSGAHESCATSLKQSLAGLKLIRSHPFYVRSEMSKGLCLHQVFAVSTFISQRKTH